VEGLGIPRLALSGRARIAPKLGDIHQAKPGNNPLTIFRLVDNMEGLWLDRRYFTLTIT